MTGRSTSLHPRGRYGSLSRFTLMPPRRRDVAGLPEPLKDASPTVKLVWLWLEPQGVVDYSQREVAAALGIEQRSLPGALRKLRELELLEDLERAPGKRGKLRAKRPD